MSVDAHTRGARGARGTFEPSSCYTMSQKRNVYNMPLTPWIGKTNDKDCFKTVTHGSSENQLHILPINNSSKYRINKQFQMVNQITSGLNDARGQLVRSVWMRFWAQFRKKEALTALGADTPRSEWERRTKSTHFNPLASYLTRPSPFMESLYLAWELARTMPCVSMYQVLSKKGSNLNPTFKAQPCLPNYH